MLTEESSLEITAFTLGYDLNKTLFSLELFSKVKMLSTDIGICNGVHILQANLWCISFCMYVCKNMFTKTITNRCSDRSWQGEVNWRFSFLLSKRLYWNIVHSLPFYAALHWLCNSPLSQVFLHHFKNSSSGVYGLWHNHSLTQLNC